MSHDNLPENKKLIKNEHSLAILSQKIDNHYKEGMRIYAEKLNNYALQAEELKNQIISGLKEKEREELELLKIEQNIHYAGRLLEKLNENFFQKIHSIDELKTEYSKFMETSEYEKILQHKKSKLRFDLDEIEEAELTLAQQELEHINLLMLITPKRNNIIELEESLKKIELEKESFSLKKLYQIPQLAFQKNQEIPTEVIEVDESE